MVTNATPSRCTGPCPPKVLPCRSVDRVAERDPDGGDVNGAAPDVVAFVVPGGHGSVLLQLVDGSLDDVAVGAPPGVERRWAAPGGAPLGAVADLVGAFRDDTADSASTQVGPVGLAGVGPVGQHPARANPGPARPAATDPDPSQHRPESQAVPTLAAAGHPGDRTTPRVRGQVNLAGQAASGAPQRLPLPAGPRAVG